MIFDLILASLHHFLIFLLLAFLVCEMVSVREDISAPAVKNLALIDALYGILAVLVIIIGSCRVIWGLKGADYYLHNLFFWFKMIAFLAVGLCSVPPTLAFRRWRKALSENNKFSPSAQEVVKVRRWLIRQFTMFGFIPIFAAIMARYSGYIGF